jgi:hypothetical protein
MTLLLKSFREIPYAVSPFKGSSNNHRMGRHWTDVAKAASQTFEAEGPPTSCPPRLLYQRRQPLPQPAPPQRLPKPPPPSSRKISSSTIAPIVASTMSETIPTPS